MKRILVTGSRSWDLPFVIRDALRAHGPGTVVQGDAPGADRIAAWWAKRWDWTVESHPAKWDLYQGDAGSMRNQEMVELGADVVLAFPRGKASGTRDCMRRAHAIGLEVVEFRHPEDE